MINAFISANFILPLLQSDMSSYGDKHKRYYQANRDKILEKEKDKKRWLTYYAENKEAVKERNLRKYHMRNRHITGDLPFSSPVTIEHMMSIGIALDIMDN